ncbi:hypothetical protein SISNIDRAFT_469742 [Sistotremastrum niveocremeum HHB9708]|uniref:Uncharacterized protein n=1 Tax=Sistotremastrum niveocremeum HHB9708 TaxID=1314777 RepID=A0A164PLL8_9AGAM|nr:hypothetical protein SISNIDRAFT_469742 [Sistotremastrum niveocremeum HHB9708]
MPYTGLTPQVSRDSLSQTSQLEDGDQNDRRLLVSNITQDSLEVPIVSTQPLELPATICQATNRGRVVFSEKFDKDKAEKVNKHKVEIIATSVQYGTLLGTDTKVCTATFCLTFHPYRARFSLEFQSPVTTGLFPKFLVTGNCDQLPNPKFAMTGNCNCSCDDMDKTTRTVHYYHPSGSEAQDSQSTVHYQKEKHAKFTAGFGNHINGQVAVSSKREEEIQQYCKLAGSGGGQNVWFTFSENSHVGSGIPVSTVVTVMMYCSSNVTVETSVHCTLESHSRLRKKKDWWWPNDEQKIDSFCFEWPSKEQLQVPKLLESDSGSRRQSLDKGSDSEQLQKPSALVEPPRDGYRDPAASMPEALFDRRITADRNKDEDGVSQPRPSTASEQTLTEEIITSSSNATTQDNSALPKELGSWPVNGSQEATQMGNEHVTIVTESPTPPPTIEFTPDSLSNEPDLFQGAPDEERITTEDGIKSGSTTAGLKGEPAPAEKLMENIAHADEEGRNIAITGSTSNRTGRSKGESRQDHRRGSEETHPSPPPPPPPPPRPQVLPKTEPPTAPFQTNTDQSQEAGVINIPLARQEGDHPSISTKDSGLDVDTAVWIQFAGIASPTPGETDHTNCADTGVASEDFKTAKKASRTGINAVKETDDNTSATHSNTTTTDPNTASDHQETKETKELAEKAEKERKEIEEKAEKERKEIEEQAKRKRKELEEKAEKERKESEAKKEKERKEKEEKERKEREEKEREEKEEKEEKEKREKEEKERMEKEAAKEEIVVGRVDEEISDTPSSRALGDTKDEDYHVGLETSAKKCPFGSLDIMLDVDVFTDKRTTDVEQWSKRRYTGSAGDCVPVMDDWICIDDQNPSQSLSESASDSLGDTGHPPCFILFG